jgi:hypothetical protein
MAAIDVGPGAIDRNSTDSGYTNICMSNPANASGTLTSIEVWTNENQPSGNVVVATFEQVDTNTFTARDSVTLGAITAGAKRTITTDENSDAIALTVVEGDYLGAYVGSGYKFEYTLNDSGGGCWYKSGDQTSCVSTAFSTDYGLDDDISIYATGSTEEAAEDNAIFFGTNF